MIKEPSFTIGMEEEYMLVDPATRRLAEDRPEGFLEACTEVLGERVKPEFKRAQVEVQTNVCQNITEARRDLCQLRSTVAGEAHKHGLAPIAASTHPLTSWTETEHTDRDRYNQLALEMAVVARRLVISGMHVHVGIEDEDLRVDLMNQVSYFLPHLLALSTSSPFWSGGDTGMMSYRLSVFDELPRTGLPEPFENWGEWQRHVNVMVNAGLIEDSTKIWWDVRPAQHFPTLEMRIADICSRLEDGLTVAAIYVCLLRMLWRLRRENQRWRRYANLLVNENRWLAQRYGTDGKLVDFGKGEAVPYADLTEEIIELVGEDADALGCRAELEHARTIVDRGTSAHRQRGAFTQAREQGASHEEALQAVVDLLIEEYVIGLDAACGAGASALAS